MSISTTSPVLVEEGCATILTRSGLPGFPAASIYRPGRVRASVARLVGLPGPQCGGNGGVFRHGLRACRSYSTRDQFAADRA